jgi:DNA-binding transcriptional LysR family regulator
MNIRQLKSLVTFHEEGSFAAAGEKLGLSHSAISVQMQQMEEELAAALFDRSSRPAQLTPLGLTIAHQAAKTLEQFRLIEKTAAGEVLQTSISIGFVPTTMQSLLPAVLNQLRNDHPDLQVKVKTSLSGELAEAVSRQELDFAFLTSPIVATKELTVKEIADEPLYVIGPASCIDAATDAELAQMMPFISFNKKSWLGQQISARLQSRGIFVQEVMELDSIDTIESLVAQGFGVSIVPQRLLANPLSSQLTKISFCDPAESRKLVLVSNNGNPNHQLAKIIDRLSSELIGNHAK